MHTTRTIPRAVITDQQLVCIGGDTPAPCTPRGPDFRRRFPRGLNFPIGVPARSAVANPFKPIGPNVLCTSLLALRTAIINVANVPEGCVIFGHHWIIVKAEC